MTASRSPQILRQFPGWPSGQGQDYARLRPAIGDLVRRLGFQSGGLRKSDAKDGLGPFSSFCFKDHVLGIVVLVQHHYAPYTGTDILIDAGIEGSRAIERLEELFSPLKKSDVLWITPAQRGSGTPEHKTAVRIHHSSRQGNGELDVSLVDTVLQEITEALKRGEPVKIFRFGTFRPKPFGRVVFEEDRALTKAIVPQARSRATARSRRRSQVRTG